MGDSGPDFTDWQSGSRRRRLVVDSDFSWSDAPAPRRRGELAKPSGRPESGTIVIERDGGFDDDAGYRDADSDRYRNGDSRDSRRPRTAADMTVYADDEADVQEYDYPEAVDDYGYTQPVAPEDVYASHTDSELSDTPSGRRTVVITGHGNRGYETVHHRDAGNALTRRGLRPDSVAMWAVLLGIALLLGSLAH